MSKPSITVPDFSQTQMYAIRFNPAGAYSFLRNQLYDFTDRMIDFKSVSKKLEQQLAAIFLSEKSLCEKIKDLDKFFIRCFDEG